MDRRFIPVIEGTLKGPDTAFGLLRYPLRQLGVDAARQILFVADGARWIWNRISELIDSLGLTGSRVYELVDFYHAVEHLSKVAEFKKNWKPSEKNRWIEKHRHMLLKGQTDQVISVIRTFCRGRNSKDIAAPTPHELQNSRGSKASDRKRCHGKRSSKSGEPSDEGRFHILAGTDGRGDAHAALLL